MDGALASVVGGLVPCPVIGLPTSVGYGSARGGRDGAATRCSARARPGSPSSASTTGSAPARSPRGSPARPAAAHEPAALPRLRRRSRRRHAARRPARRRRRREALERVPGPARLGPVEIRVSARRAARHRRARTSRSCRPPRARRTGPGARCARRIEAPTLPPRARQRRARPRSRALADAEARVHGVAGRGRSFPRARRRRHARRHLRRRGARSRRSASTASSARRSRSPRGLRRRPRTACCRCPRRRRVELLRGAPGRRRRRRQEELVTPTGAALAVDARRRVRRAARRSRSSGSATGPAPPTSRSARTSSASCSARPSPLPAAEVVLLETNLDDLNPELVPDAVERCFAAGALDVWIAPVQMKKGRPGHRAVGARPPARRARRSRSRSSRRRARSAFASRASAATSSSGEERVDRARRAAAVRVKVGLLDGRVVNVAPEHDDCAALARADGPAGEGRSGPRRSRRSCDWRAAACRGYSRPCMDPRRCSSSSRIAGLGSAVVAFSGGVDSSLVAALAARALRRSRAGGDRGLPGARDGRARRRQREVARRDRDRARDDHDRRARAGGVPAQRPRPLLPLQDGALRSRLAALAARGGSRPSSPARTPTIPGTGGRACARRRSTASSTRCSRPGWARPRCASSRAALGVPSAEKPASPCLASRLPYGTPVEPEVARAGRPRRAGAEAARLPGAPRAPFGELGRVQLGRGRAAAGAERRGRAADRGRGPLGRLRAVEIDPEPFRSGSLNAVFVGRLGG